MAAFKDITGMRFGRLVATRPAERPEGARNRSKRWEFRCDCGALHVTYLNALRGGAGCPDCVAVFRRSVGTKHGGHKTRLNRIWRGLRCRCHNPNEPGFKNYGARGITVSEVWDDFSAFQQWALAHGYADDLQIDRIDNDGDYTPENCRWTDRKTNNRNTRKNRFVEYQGRKMTLSELAEVTGVTYGALRWRLAKGMTPDQAVEMTP